MEKCVYLSSGTNTVRIWLRRIVRDRGLQACSAVLLFTAATWAQSGAAPASAVPDTAVGPAAAAPDVAVHLTKPEQKAPVPYGAMADTVLSPLGGYGTAPPPASGRYDLPDFAPITQLNRQLPRWIQFGIEERFRF